MKVEILATKTSKDPSSFKNWSPTDELYDGWVNNEEAIDRLNEGQRAYYDKTIKKIEKLVSDHNDVIRQIASVRKNQKLVSLLRETSDKLESELVMTVEIVNDFLDKADAEKARPAKKKSA